MLLLRELRGQNVQLFDQDSRATVLAALSSVDAVIFFDEDTPEDAIKSISPDILVKGSDYQIEEIVGAEFVINNGGEVKTIPLIEGISTSTIIHKIRQNENT